MPSHINSSLFTVLAMASLACIATNREYRELHEHYHQEKKNAEQLHGESVTLLNSLGIPHCSLEKYFDSCLQKRFESLQSCQCLLSTDYITQLQNIIPKEGVSVVSVLCVRVIY